MSERGRYRYLDVRVGAFLARRLMEPGGLLAVGKDHHGREVSGAPAVVETASGHRLRAVVEDDACGEGATSNEPTLFYVPVAAPQGVPAGVPPGVVWTWLTLDELEAWVDEVNDAAAPVPEIALEPFSGAVFRFLRPA